MEKKGNHISASTSRGSSGTDLKKSIDVPASKQGSRGGCRRREPPCGFSKTNETFRTPHPQRDAKASDKRPKPRRFYATGVLPRSEETSLGELEAPELDFIFSPGSKKQNWNYLLNFSYATRETDQGNYRRDKSSGNKQGGKWSATKKHKYNKEHFLQANCQFIVNEKGDYRQYMNNPDTLVNWDLIEQVNIQVNEEPSCPICLYPPMAAKMTKCGHVYCWPCILHYLALCEQQSSKCPICYDAIRKDDLKSVIAIPHKTFSINDTITFKLMKRRRGSLTAYPADALIQPEDKLCNISDKNKDNRYSKLLLANTDNILEILDRENAQLDLLMAETEESLDRCFMEEARQILNSRRNDVLDHNLVTIKESCERSEDEATSGSCSDKSDINVLDDIDVFSKSSISEAEGSVSKFFYFYQAEDGQHIYLHAINAKMLEHCYGSLEFGPKTLTGRILEKEGGSMTEELRKRLRYLQHLPVTCQFEVAEINLSKPIVSKKTLEYFKDQLEVRKKRRQRRAKEEKRREKRIEIEENRKIGKFETPNLHLDSRDQFPDVKEAHDMFPDFLDNRQKTESESTFLSLTERSVSPDLDSSMSNMSLETNYAGPSFATMVASEKSPWPNLKKAKLANQSSSTPVKLINVTASGMTNVNVLNKSRHGDPEEDGFEPVPVFHRSFGDALAEALAKGLNESGDAENTEAEVSNKKKKKKNKQKLLFSTHMPFSGH